MCLDEMSLFMRIPTDKTLTGAWDNLAADLSLEESTWILKHNLMEMLTFCVETTDFEMGSDIYWQEQGLAMWSPF